MKKRSLILIPILVVFIVASGILLLNQRTPPAWQVKLNQYLTYIGEIDRASPRVISSTTATTPTNFMPGMSSETYSTNIIFETSRGQSGDYAIDLQPMPYPPEEIIFVLLDVAAQNQLVYVALHNSLYNADWIVHISPEPWGKCREGVHHFILQHILFDN